MAGLSISRAWEETRAVFAHDGQLIASVALALIVLPETISGAIAPPPSLSGQDVPAAMNLVALLIAILGVLGQIAIARLALGPSTSVGDAIAHGARRVGFAFLALFLFGMVLALLLLPLVLLLAGPNALASINSENPSPQLMRGMLVALVIGLLAAPRFQLVVPTAAGEPGGPIRLLRRSWDLSRGNYWKLFGFLALIFVVAIILVLFVGQIVVGLLIKSLFGTVAPLSVGALAAALLTACVSAAFAALFSVMLARIYAQLAGARASVPSSGT